VPELRHLRCFVAAAEELNFTRAAARQHVVQQSLSATIKQLEQELGARLFDRTTRVVRLTAAGEEFLPAARRVLAEADRAFAAVADHAAARPELAVGFSFTLDDQVRYRLLERFVAEHPGTRLRVHVALSGELLDLVGAGELDLAVTFCPLLRRGVEMATVMRLPVWVLLTEGHRLADRQELELADLRDEVFLLAAEPDGAGFNAWLRDTCRDAGFAPRTMFSPPVAMNIRVSDVAPDAVTLAPWQAQFTADGSVLRPLRPDVTVPYVAAIRAGTGGIARRAFDAVVAAGPAVSAPAEVRRRRGGAQAGHAR
jgi:DNA-binding transcriptional LysR family regulator